MSGAILGSLFSNVVFARILCLLMTYSFNRNHRSEIEININSDISNVIGFDKIGHILYELFSHFVVRDLCLQ